ncbi:MAG: hypothetical protein E7400_05270 [Ruminococcaceae bacterium]|nr:hypothetical protein [Oscillospiraceae bacterium]
MLKIAHRSGPSLYPEQTIRSAKYAIEQGADMVEIDVRFTKDKQIAITHDKNLNRIFGVDRDVSDMTAEEFLALRHKKNREYSAHMLTDYLACGIEPLLLHIKEPEVVPVLLSCLDEHHYLEKVVFGVQSLESIALIRAYKPGLKILAFMPTCEDIEAFADAGADYIRLWEKWMDAASIAKVRTTGKKLWIMSGNYDGYNAGEPPEEGLKTILGADVDGILINDIEYLNRMMEQEADR